MSNRRPILDYPRNEAGLVDEFIGTAYDTVKNVADNLLEIQRLDAVLEEIPVLAQTTVDAALAEAIPPIMTDIQVLVDEAAASAQQAEAAVEGTIRVPASEGSIDPLPLAAQRAGMTLGFDELGNQVMQNFPGPYGSRKIGYLAPFVGSFLRTLEDKLSSFVDPRDFGAVANGNYYPVSDWYTIGFTYYRGFDSLAHLRTVYPFVTNGDQSVDWAALQAALNTKKPIDLGDGKYIVNDTLKVPKATRMRGAVTPQWTAGFPQFVDDSTGTHILAYGTIPKTKTLLHMSKCENSGGVVANPSADQPHYAAANTPTPLYELHDFSNENANGATAATPKAFSVLFDVEHGGNIVFEDFRIVPYFRGQEGYKTMTEAGLGADCDVALYLPNSEHSTLNRVQVVGYWRAQGLLKVNQIPQGQSGNSERDSYFHCRFQGHTGLAIRGNDLHQVLEVTPTTIAIKWYKSHTFPPSGEIRASGANRKYTSLTFDESRGYLVFHMASTAGATVGADLGYANGNFGSSGTQIWGCSIHDLYHMSRMCSNNTNIGFSKPGKCVEISGEPSRAIQFWGCTIQGRDDIMVQQLHSRDSIWYGCYFEPQPAYANLHDGSYFHALPAGGRHIAGSNGAPHPSGIVSNMRMYGCTPVANSWIDVRPASPIGTPDRFNAPGDLGLFNPREVYDDRYAIQTTGKSLRIRSVDALRLLSGSRIEIGGFDGPDQWLVALGSSLVLSAATRVKIAVADVDQYIFDAARIIPTSAGKDLGNTFGVNTFERSFVKKRYYTASLWDGGGAGTPEGVETAVPGCTWRRTNGGTSTTFYVKETGTGNTGWVAK